MISIPVTLSPIGNSQGIRIPKDVLRFSGLLGETDLELVIHEEGLLLKASDHPRSNWDNLVKQSLDQEGPLSIEEDWSSMDNDLETMNEDLGVWK